MSTRLARKTQGDRTPLPQTPPRGCLLLLYWCPQGPWSGSWGDVCRAAIQGRALCCVVPVHRRLRVSQGPFVLRQAASASCLRAGDAVPCLTVSCARACLHSCVAQARTCASRGSVQRSTLSPSCSTAFPQAPFSLVCRTSANTLQKARDYFTGLLYGTDASCACPAGWQQRVSVWQRQAVRAAA